jgi:hypothetical protein
VFIKQATHTQTHSLAHTHKGRVHPHTGGGEGGEARNALQVARVPSKSTQHTHREKHARLNTGVASMAHSLVTTETPRTTDGDDDAAPAPPAGCRPLHQQYAQQQTHHHRKALLSVKTPNTVRATAAQAACDQPSFSEQGLAARQAHGRHFASQGAVIATAACQSVAPQAALGQTCLPVCVLGASVTLLLPLLQICVPGCAAARMRCMQPVQLMPIVRIDSK